MDYSLLVAIRTEAPSNGTTHHLRVYLDNGAEAYLCLSIIDFLQKWTCGKRVARCIKVFECNKATVPPRIYAKRFQRHFEACFIGDVPPQVVGKDADAQAGAPTQVAPPAGAEK